MNLQPNIPKPSRNEVEKYLLKWRQLENITIKSVH